MDSRQTRRPLCLREHWGEIPKVQPSVLGDLTQNFFAAFPFFSPSLVLRLKDYGYYGSVISVEFIT